MGRKTNLTGMIHASIGKISGTVLLVLLLAVSPVTAQEAITIGGPTGYGSVFFESNPKGAAVYINDIFQGITPLLVETVQDGYYHARMSRTGYQDEFLTFDVAAGLQSHVTAVLPPLGNTYFAPRELYTTLIYEHSHVNANGWGIGNSWGGYFRGINLENTIGVHIGVLNSVVFEGMAGYGFILGRRDRIRITPQVGYAGVWNDNIETGKSVWLGYVRAALNFKCAFIDQYAFSATALYDRTGPGLRAGVLFYFN